MYGIHKREITDILDIDWNAVITKKKMKLDSAETVMQYWDKRAPSFIDPIGKTAYPNAFLKIMRPQPSWTVLDMGCGAGTLSLPLASRVKKITAVDFSAKMLEMLDAEIQRQAIKNIRTVRASWEEDWSKKNIGTHDVAIASRSLSVQDIKAAINKLNKAARKRVYISTVVGDGPRDRRIFEVIKRELIPPVDYIYIYNLLYQMGIHSNLSFIAMKTEKTFEDILSAKDYIGEILDNMTYSEKQRLDRFLREKMVIKDGRSVIEYKKTYKWAVIWWEKDR